MVRPVGLKKINSATYRMEGEHIGAHLNLYNDYLPQRSCVKWIEDMHWMAGDMQNRWFCCITNHFKLVADNSYIIM